jgi:hypothetical protein
MKGTIGGADFAAALFAIWFGADPADKTQRLTSSEVSYDI